MRYSIVIPTYNNCEKYLKPCIDSIIKYTDMTDVELVISANGCTDNTQAYLNYLHSAIPHLRVVWSDKALGYSKATNEGIIVSAGEYIILLNNDTVFLEQDKNYWLRLFDKPFENYPNCGISCIIKGASEPAGRDFAVFFCVMVHRKVFDRIGLLNEEYGVGGGEDTEFCIEAENAGFEVIEVLNKKWEGIQYTGGFPIYHKGEGTMHDPELVQGWDKIFKENSERLAKKYNSKQVKDEIRWMSDLSQEANEHFNEVVNENIYGVSKQILKDREVIDIGANIGTFSIFASKLGAKKVIAVEPVSSTVAIFKSNIEKAQTQNIVVNQNIASNESGNMVKIALHEKTGHNSVYNTSDKYEEISTISLKDLLSMAEGDNIFLKMDCEGGEYDILLNADFQDMDRISTVAIEIHGDLHPVYKGIDIIRNKLQSFGLRQIKQTKVGCWDGVDQYGNYINYRDLNLAQEIWVR